MAKEAEEAATKGNMRDLFDITKKLTGKYQQKKPIKDKEGKTLIGIKEQINRWTEHFKELLIRPAPLNPPLIQASQEDLPINCDKPSKEEIKKAILLLRSEKSCRPRWNTCRSFEGKY